MRNYFKPAMEMVAFEVEDIITASSTLPTIDPNQQGFENTDMAVAPIADAVNFN